MTKYKFRGREHDSLNYYPDSSSASSAEASQQIESHDTPWQLVPPIITGGRIAAVRPAVTPPVPSISQTPLPVPQAPLSQSQQPAPANEDTPLFHISFAGPDQQWYRISIGAHQVKQNLLASPPTTWTGNHVVTPAASPYVEQDYPQTQRQRRPVWQEEEVAHSTWDGVREKWQQGVRPGLPPAEHLSYLDDRLVRPLGPNTTPQPVWKEPARPSSPPAQFGENAKSLLLQIIQPGLPGLMSGSVLTLAPIFTVAFATRQPFTVFLVGMASALGAGMSMAFSEALSDDGEIIGRGQTFLRGGVIGLMTFVSGVGHALPFLIPHIQIALFTAYAVVALELLAITAIRHKYLGTKWWRSIVQVVGGGLLVLLTALLLGNA